MYLRSHSHHTVDGWGYYQFVRLITLAGLENHHLAVLKNTSKNEDVTAAEL